MVFIMLRFSCADGAGTGFGVILYCPFPVFSVFCVSMDAVIFSVSSFEREISIIPPVRQVPPPPLWLSLDRHDVPTLSWVGDRYWIDRAVRTVYLRVCMVHLMVHLYAFTHG